MTLRCIVRGILASAGFLHETCQLPVHRRAERRGNRFAPFIGDAENGAQAVERVPHLLPDVVFMDVRMPELTGLEAAEKIFQLGLDPAPKIIMLTTFDLDDYVYEALRLGCSGFLLKDAQASELIRAVRLSVDGEALWRRR